MKLIQQISLYLQEGRSDKVYEVDLCEVAPDQYVVNFRYGRRGTTLRDGSKTPAPVSREEAQRIYDRIVAEKTGKGYRETSPSGPPPVVAERVEPPPVAVTAVLTPQARAVLDRLARGHADRGSWPLSRAVWRAGQMRLREAEPMLTALIGSGDSMLDYCLAWSLAQCGSADSVAALRQLQTNRESPAAVRRIAAEALRALMDDEGRGRIIAGWIGQLPQQLRDAAAGGPADAFQQALAEHLEKTDHTGYLALDLIYLIDNEHVRPALLHALKTAPLMPNYFQRIRHIFKAAELWRDAEVFGLIARRIETTRATWAPYSGYYYQATKTPKPTLGPTPEKAFGKPTRLYLRRRTWRTLRRLGELESGDYARLAAGVLLAMTDEDAQPPRQAVRYDWSGFRSRTVTMHWDRYGGYWAFSQILYQNSPRYRPDPGGKTFRCVPPYEPGGAAPAEREEAFPHLWERSPDVLLQLLRESRCEVVHRFAAKAMRDCAEFCSKLDVNVLVELIESPYEPTVELAFDLASARYHPTRPDRMLVLALANCGLERARQQAHRWIQTQPSFFFEDTDFIVALLGSRHADTRQFAGDALRAVTLSDSAASAVIGRSFALLQSMTAEDGDRARDVAETLLRIFPRQLATIGPDVIRDLLAHPLAEVQQFAGDLVLGHQTLAQHPPEDVLRALINAEHAPVLGVGVRSISQLPDDVLTQSVELLVALLRHAMPDLRDAIRPTVVRLARSDPQFGRRIAEMLIEQLLVPGAPEGVPSHTSRVLREDLRDRLAGVPGETVWKLLRSRSSPAQEVGGMLLPTNVSVDNLGVKEIVKLADHDVLSVREAAWRMCSDNIDRLRAEMVDAVRILDARKDDSRQFAFQLFRDQFLDEELTPDVLISICDSVRPDVQQFGRELVTRRFDEAHGPEYLVKLSEHPAASMQLFASNFLVQYAGDDLDRLRQLTPYFVSVLSRVNRGRIARDRVLAFLEQWAGENEEAAGVVAEILTRQSATCAIGDKARAIQIMVEIGDRYPQIALPIQVQPVEVRGGV